ncbi:phosphoribosylglycinamide formyltransferase [Silvimonas sp. JCM 19000]
MFLAFPSALDTRFMKNIVILISGRGSNMQAIVNARIAGARVAAVISNRPQAAGLTWAQQNGIATAVLDHKEFADRDQFDAALMTLIDQHAPDLVVLAGFMRIVTPAFVAHYANRMINVHPSLLPAFTGLHTHARAIEAGVKLHGCTAHFVTAELDHGPIIAQAAVPVLDDDTPETLAARVLECEHTLYPQAVARFVAGGLQIDGQRVRDTQQVA